MTAEPMKAEIETEPDIVHECELDAPREKVWRAVTVPEFLEQWIGIAPDGKDPDQPAYRIVEANEPAEVAYEWHDGETDRPHSTVRIELDPAPGGRTRFRLTHRSRAAPVMAANDNRTGLSKAA